VPKLGFNAGGGAAPPGLNLYLLREEREMATVTACGTQRTAQDEAPRLHLSASRGLIGAILFLLVAFFLLAAGAVSGAPQGSGAPVETGAFILDPSIGSAQG
jgi:hypothetical protein